MSVITLIEIESITTFDRMRQADRAHVDALAESIGEVGLLNPITVAPEGRGYALIAGMHRLEAARHLGWTDIPASILDLDEHRRVIAECDENLCAPSLTAAERAVFTRRRKAAYEALHPQAKHGSNQHTRGVADSATPSFADDQAAKTGQAPRTVRQDAERGEKVCEGALALLKNTRLDNGKYLDGIKNLTPEEQVMRVKADLIAPAMPKPKAPKPEADPDAPPVDPAEAKMRRELKAMTTDGLIDEVIGLRRAVDERKASERTLKEDLKRAEAVIKEMSSADDKNRSIALLDRQLKAATGRINEHLATIKKMEFRLKKSEARVKELEAMPVSMDDAA